MDMRHTATFNGRLAFLIGRIRERLWVKPLAVSGLSVAAALLAKAADGTDLGQIVPNVSADSVESLLSVMASGMLVIATFAVTSMVSAYASASNTASPRSFPLVVADDLSQRALATFIGAFIFSVVGLVTAKNDFYQAAGRFVLFVLTLLVFALVVFVFVHWVDRIARLGRLETTIEGVEKATTAALQRWRDAPALHGVPASPGDLSGRAVLSDTVGYLQHIDIAALQDCAECIEGRIRLAVLPGTLVSPVRALGYVSEDALPVTEADRARIVKAFVIGKQRTYDDDPRYGLIVLSQIADRALSPGVNDPGTAIDIIAILMRLFVFWAAPSQNEDGLPVKFDRIEVPALSVDEMFDDAFTAITRDGSRIVEVSIRLQKALASLASMGDAGMRDAAIRHARRALACAEKGLDVPTDLAAVRHLAAFAEQTPDPSAGTIP